MFGNLFGSPRLFVSGGRVQRQLELGGRSYDDAAAISSLAAAVDGTLAANPAIVALLPGLQARALAAQYGTMLSVIESAHAAADRAGDVEASARFVTLRAELGDIVRLMQTAVPEDSQQQAGPADELIPAIPDLSDLGVMAAGALEESQR